MTSSPPAEDQMVVLWSRRRVLGRALRIAILIPLCGYIAWDARLNPGMRGLCAGLAVLISLLTASVLQRLIRSRPPLTLSDAGFEAPHLFQGVVPWFGVQAVRFVGNARASSLLVTLHDWAAEDLVPSRGRRVRLGLRLARRSRLVLDLSLLDRPAADIADLFETRRRQAAPFTRRVISDRERSVTMALTRSPRFAYGLAILLAVILACEYRFALRPTAPLANLDTLTLWSMGASQRLAVVRDGQWWRLVTASLLHGGAAHLVFNGIALWLAARLLERVIGWGWFAACFAVSAVCGSVLSMMWNAPETVGVGASGGIIGLSAATAVIALHFSQSEVGSRMLLGAVQILLPSLLPSIHAGGMTIDIAAHAGGALGGAAMGCLIRALWDRETPQPRLGVLGAAIAGVYFAIAAASLVPITHIYQVREAAEALDPTFPKDFKVAVAHAAQLLTSYPRDPRVRAAHAEMLVRKDDIAGAETELRAALADKPMLAEGVTTSEPYLRVRLAQLLAADNKRDEAGTVLKPACGTATPSLKAAITQLKLCR